MSSNLHYKNPHPLNLRSQIGQIVWPGIPNPWAGGVLSALYQMDQSQWWSEEMVRHRQFEQAKALIQHAYSFSSLYRSRYDKDGLHPDQLMDWDDWGRLPIIRRQDLQQAGESWYSQQPPTDHGELLQQFTSGSTGRPLLSKSTTLTYLIKLALVLRNHQWAMRDTAKRAAFIQDTGETYSASGTKAECWQKSLDPIVVTGASLKISVKLSLKEQVDLLQEFRPAYLFGYPSIIFQLAKYCQDHQIMLSGLEQIGTFGEVLEPSCRSLVREVLDVPVIDGYSAKEIGPIALQCPEAEHYHVQSDAVIVEVLDDQGNVCGPGQVGRIVVTSLHNFASPMIRYEIGDYAEVGGHCHCGRHLPVLKRVLGRQRNMLKYPDGRLHWPSLGNVGFAKLMALGLPPIQQFQIIQHGMEQLEVRVVLQRSFTQAEEVLVAAYLHEQFGLHWRFTFSYPKIIERSARGKFEDFISLC